MTIVHAMFLLSVLAADSARVATAASLLSLNPAGAALEGAASYETGAGPSAGIRLPDGAVSSFALGFVLPPDYVAGGRIRVGIAWHTKAAAPCTSVLAPNFISVARVGRGHIVGQGLASGLLPTDGNMLLSASATNITSLKYYEIRSPDGVTALQAADVINFGLFRQSNSSEDTCAGDLMIQGVGILIG
jgi:hypothetical protein